MITLESKPVPDAEARQIKQWLKQPEYQSFKRLIYARIAMTQVKVGEIFIEATDQQSDVFKGEAREMAKEVIMLESMMATMDELAYGDDELFIDWAFEK